MQEQRDKLTEPPKPPRRTRTILTAVIAASAAVHVALLAAAWLSPSPAEDPNHVVRMSVMQWHLSGDPNSNEQAPQDWTSDGQIRWALVSAAKLQSF